MKILILTQYYPPESGAPQARLSDLARRLQAMGYSIQVLTAMPNYPGDAIYSDYREKRFVREVIEGILVDRVKLYVPHHKNFIKRLVNYFSFSFNALWYGLGKLPRSDFLLVESPPLFLIPTAIFLAKKLKTRLIINISDLWPQSAVELGMIKPEGIIHKLSCFLEEWCYKHADLITGQTEGIIGNIKNRFPNKKVKLFPNGIDLEKFSAPIDREKIRKEFGWDNDEFVITYTGVFGHAQALEQILKAAKIIESKKRVLFAFIGNGPCREQLSQQIEAMALTNVRMYNWQKPEMMPELIGASDTGIVPLAKGKLFEGARPSKMFEIMGAGKPVILCAKGEAVEIIKDAKCGVWAPPEEPEKLSIVIEELINQPAGFLEKMGEYGRDYAEQNFNRKLIAEKFASYLEEIIVH
jgi:glycosyltransferase involved in cell wall biosynthesis